MHTGQSFGALQAKGKTRPQHPQTEVLTQKQRRLNAAGNY
jgi:hypothetical protein